MPSSVSALKDRFSSRSSHHGTADLGAEQDTFLEIFYKREEAHPERIFLRQPYGPVFREVSYRAAGEEARRMAAALKAMGHVPGDRIGIYSKNCYHWILADLAILMAGCISVPFYPTLNPAALREVIDLSGIKTLFVGKVDAWDDRAAALPGSLTKIAFPHYEGNARVHGCFNWDQLKAEHAALRPAHFPKPEDTFTIVYTSGTTGAPKGVVLTYDAPRQIAIFERKDPVYEIFQGSAEHLFSYLPLNHVAERFATEIAGIFAGATISFAESIESFAQNLRAAQPTLFFAVPRIWVKIQEGVLARIDGKLLSRLLRLPIAGEWLKRTLRKQLGLGRARVVISGAAPLARATLDWFASIGIIIQEVYGMTEAGGGVTFNARNRVRPGTVGRPISGGDVKLDPETSEILIRTPWMMREYFREPQKTAEILRNGYIHSGDRGRFDAEGNLMIVGRVSEAFKSAKGKFVIPTPLEARFAGNPHIEQVLVTGRGLPQPIALVCLAQSARDVNRAALEASLSATLGEANGLADKHEVIHTLVVLKHSFSVDNGHLTPTFKMRRHVIDAHYEEQYSAWSEAKQPVIWES